MKKTHVALMASLALAGAGVTTAVAIAGGDPGSSEATASTPDVVRAANAAVPADARSLLASGESARFGADPSTAKSYTLPASGETIWIAQAKDGGACLISQIPSATCVPAEGLKEGGILVVRPPDPSKEYMDAVLGAREAGLTGKSAEQAIEKATAGLPHVSGPSTYVGWVPNSLGVSSVRLLNADGKVLADVKPYEGVYDLRVADIATSAPTEIELARGTGEKPITIGPLPGPHK